MPCGPRYAIRPRARPPAVALLIVLTLASGGAADTDNVRPADASIPRPVPEAALLTDCPDPGAHEPMEVRSHAGSWVDRCALLDRPTRDSVACADLRDRALPDGRLEVVVSVRNREGRRLRVQVNCVFKDVQGFSTGDETPFRDLVLAENSTAAVTFTSVNTQARLFTIRIQLAR